MYVTKVGTSSPKIWRIGRAYLARFFGFALGVNGSGGVLSIACSNASALFLPSPAGRNSTSAITAARSAAVGGFFMVGV